MNLHFDPHPISTSARLLRSFAIAGKYLLTIKDYDESVDLALDVIGSAAEVDRIYIFQNPETEGSAIRCRWQWVGKGATLETDNPNPQDLSLVNHLPRWYEILSGGEPVKGTLEYFPESERSLLLARGILSLVVVPIFIHDHFWGFIEYHYCHHKQLPEEDTQIALIAFAGTIAGSIARRMLEAERDALQHNHRVETALYQVIEGTTSFTGEAFFSALVCNMASVLGVRYVSVSQATEEGFQVLAFCADGETVSPRFVPYEFVPWCYQALQTGLCIHSCGIRDLYPDSPLFRDLQIEGYIGMGLRNVAGEPIGIFCIFHDRPLAELELAKTLLSSFSGRVGAELERLTTVKALEQFNTDLEEQVGLRTAQLAEREALLEDFLDNANDLIQMVNINTGRFEFVNQAWRKVLGYTDVEVEQLTIFDVLTPECHIHCQGIMEQMRAGNITQIEAIELYFLTKSGQKVIVEGNINCRFETGRDGTKHPVYTRAIFRDITARKALERELRQREARYRGLMEGASDAIIIANPQGYIVEANQKAEEILGYSIPELIGKHFAELHPPEELDRATEGFGQIAQKQRTKINEVVFCKRDGSRVFIDITASVIEIDGERLIQGIFRDISERKAAAEALQESQQFLQTVLDTVPLTVFWKDRDSNYLGANSKFLQDAGLSSVSELIGKNDFDMPWGSTEAELYRSYDRSVIESGESMLGIIETQHQEDSREIWLETNKLPLRNLVGEIVGILGTYQDITARRNAEIVLQRQLAAIEAAIDGIGILDGEHYHYLYLNSSHVKMFGYEKAEELIGNTWRFLYSPEELARFEREILPILLECGSWQGEAVATRKDGTTFPQQLSLTLTDNNILICVCQDISERKNTENYMRQQAEHQRLLREITQRIRQSLDLQVSFDTACQEIRQVLRADRVGIFTFYPSTNYDQGEFVAESMVAGWPSVLTVKVQDHCFGENYVNLYAQGKFHAADDIYNNGLQTCHRDILAQFGIRANLVIPLLCGETLWGLLCIHQCSAPRKWQEIEINLVQELANQLGIAIQQASLYERVQSELVVREKAEAKIALQLQRQNTLAGISQLILQQSLDLQDILIKVSHQIKKALNGDRVIVFRLYPDGTSAIVEEAVSDGLPRLRDKQWENEVWSEDILEHYWQGQPRIVPDVMDDVWTDCLREYSIEGQIKSKIIAPILQEIGTPENHRWVAPATVHKLWGILVIHACTEKRVWQETEAQLLQQVANQLAMAIQQATLFEQLQAELRERLKAESQLTERNQQLAVINTELARATRLKDEFLANMSHELRTPLNAILGMTEGLVEEIFGIVNEKQIKALDTIEKSASHLLALINDILDVAKIEAGQIHLEYSQVSIEHLCSSSISFIKQQALKKRIQLETHVPSNLPYLWADEIRMRQVLLNLLTNAVKFTPEGGRVSLNVSLVSSKSDAAKQPQVLIAVKDTGIGIAPENINKLFQPFVQIDSALNRQYSGTGLGLSLVKQIVELHGGKVGLTSKIGVGSCFMVAIPYKSKVLQASSAIDKPVASGTSGGVRDSTSIGSPLILLAEDNPDNIATISSYLEAKGYRLLLANNGQEAIALTLSHHPHMILMDIQMPGMDGLEAIRQIRQQESLRKIPIIALTALAMKGDRERCLAAGADTYLSKPVKLKQLNMLIQELISLLSESVR